MHGHTNNKFTLVHGLFLQWRISEFCEAEADILGIKGKVIPL